MCARQSRFERWGTRTLNRFMQDRGVVHFDAVPIEGEQTIRIVVEHVTDVQPQAVALSMNAGAGEILWDDQWQKAVVLWVSAIGSWDVVVRSEAGILNVRQMWEERRSGYSTVFSLSDFSGMIVEDGPGYIRYRCNNGLLDDEFDKLVFRLEFVTESDSVPA